MHSKFMSFLNIHYLNKHSFGKKLVCDHNKHGRSPEHYFCSSKSAVDIAVVKITSMWGKRPQIGYIYHFWQTYPCLHIAWFYRAVQVISGFERRKLWSKTPWNFVKTSFIALIRILFLYVYRDEERRKVKKTGTRKEEMWRESRRRRRSEVGEMRRDLRRRKSEEKVA